MRQSLQASYVLHSRPYRNTSKLLDIFSREQGRRVLVARGARQGNSRLQGQLLPFIPLLLSWQGNGEVQTLTAAEAGARIASLTGPKLLTAFYLNELLLRLLARDDPHPALYDAYAQTLQRLSGSAGGQIFGEQASLRIFECFLLQELGYGLVLDYEVNSGEVIQADQMYCYQPERGPLRIESRQDCENGLPVHGCTLLALQQGNLGAADAHTDHVTLILREAKTLMRLNLASHLGPKPLHSRELYIQQKQLLKF
ncbi:DNA recombination and repair protein RecO [hydrothermal vent metagenome]|uniref:DNA repair protein RecO n=1 Tax=hydrothermal vent metagenome TaxID=652676 RepID=A0A3B1BE85_9ZZZZ